MKKLAVTGMKIESEIIEIVKNLKAPGTMTAKEVEVVIGYIVHVKSEGTKHEARGFYLVVAIDHEQSSANIQKLCDRDDS